MALVGPPAIRGPLLVVTMLLSLLATPLTTTAHAEDKVAARDHWERGTKFYDLGRYDDAIREFEAAYEAKSDPAFLYNLAQSHRLAGHSADALRFYRTYLRYAPKASNRADIEQRIAELEKVVSERPAAEPPPVTAPPVNSGAGTAAGSPPPAGPVAESPPPFNTSPPSGAGTGWPSGAVTPPPVTAESGATGTAPFAPAPAAEPRKSRRKTIAVVIAAAGGAAFLGGAMFGLVARQQSNKVETSARNGEAFDPSVESLGKSSEALQWVGYIVGVAAVATGVIIYATAPKTSEQMAQGETTRVALTPILTPTASGASLRVTF